MSKSTISPTTGENFFFLKRPRGLVLYFFPPTSTWYTPLISLTIRPVSKLTPQIKYLCLRYYSKHRINNIYILYPHHKDKDRKTLKSLKKLTLHNKIIVVKKTISILFQ